MKNTIQQPIARFCRTHRSTIGWLFFVLVCFIALSNSGCSRSHHSHGYSVGAASTEAEYTSSRSRRSHSHRNRGGHYIGGVGSSHKGGHYVNRYGDDGYLGY